MATKNQCTLIQD